MQDSDLEKQVEKAGQTKQWISHNCEGITKPYHAKLMSSCSEPYENEEYVIV